MLISVLCGPTKEEVYDQIHRSLPFVQGFELRLDLFSKETLLSLSEMRSFIRLPIIFTLRSRSEGGSCLLDEPERLKLYESFLSLQPDYCDIEASVDKKWLQAIARKFPEIQWLCSYHNFEKTPTHLEALYQSMQREECRFYKISVHANSTLDMLRLMHFAKDKKNLTWISMGILGQPSRLLGPLTGSLFSYSGLQDKDFALQQIDLQTLVEEYRFPQITQQTAVYALIGDPVEASIGHLYHNRIFKKRGKNSLYIKLRITPDELLSCIQYVRALGFSGLSMTMPHKTAIIPLLDTIDAAAQAIGAVNTVDCKNGRLTGYNTDGEGAFNAIERYFPVQGKQIAILGAGGAARAIAYEAIRRGAHVHIYNRTFAKAKTAAERLGCKAFAWDELPKEQCDLLINSIPPKDGTFPLSLEQVVFPRYVLDIAVQTEETSLSQEVKKQGSTLLLWKEMFYEQAKLQQTIWSSP